MIGRQLCTVLILMLAMALAACSKDDRAAPGTVKDEALQVGRKAESFPAAAEDYFKDMDGGIDLTDNEIKGRNNWIVWTGGNDRFWDHLIRNSFGAVDFLKILSSHPKVPHLNRDKRWQYLGLINEPCFEKATGGASGPLWAVARRAARRLSRGSVRE